MTRAKYEPPILMKMEQTAGVRDFADAHRELVIEPMLKAIADHGISGLYGGFEFAVAAGGPAAHRRARDIWHRQRMIETLESEPGVKCLLIGAAPDDRVTIEYDGAAYRLLIEHPNGGCVEGLLSAADLMGADRLCAAELVKRLSSDKAETVDEPAPRDYLQHDPTKRVGKRRREKRKGQALRSSRSSYGGGWS